MYDISRAALNDAISLEPFHSNSIRAHINCRPSINRLRSLGNSIDVISRPSTTFLPAFKSIGSSVELETQIIKWPRRRKPARPHFHSNLPSRPAVMGKIPFKIHPIHTTEEKQKQKQKKKKRKKAEQHLRLSSHCSQPNQSPNKRKSKSDAAQLRTTNSWDGFHRHQAQRKKKKETHPKTK